MSAAVVNCATCGGANPPDAQACFSCGHPLLAAAPQAAAVPTTQFAFQSFVGQLLRQRYRLLAQIGTGGFGAVYQAADTELGDRKVAVKEMSQRGLTPEELHEATQAFRNEALLLAGLTHPNLPRIYEQFSEGGRWYLVMDFIEGETLEARLSRNPGGRLPVQEVLKFGVQLCTVLDYLHTRQPPIIFRDLKPANILVTPAGDIFLIDFGIARHFKPGQTRDTASFGSAGYAAPEQYGKAQTTTQSDIYSLGATLHHLLSGADPSTSPFIFAPLDLVDPEGLEELVMQMLEAHPSKRPSSTAMIKQNLQHLAGDLATGHKQKHTLAFSAPSTPQSAPPPQRLVVTSAPLPPKSDGLPLLLYRGHKGRVNTLAWSPDGRTIASGGNDRTIQIWESASGKHLWTLQGMDWVYALAWSPDGEHIAWVSRGKTLHIWNAKTGDFRELFIRRLSIFEGFLTLAWSPDGSCLAAGGPGKTVEIWEAKTGKHLLAYRGHRRYLTDLAIYAVAWSPDGTWMASASTDARIQIWEPTTCQLRCSFRGHPSGYFRQRGAIAWSPDGKYLASTAEKAVIHIHDAATGAQRQFFQKHSGAVNTVAWSPDGKYLASGGSDQMVHVWDLGATIGAHVYSSPEGEVNAVAWSPDSTRLASAGDDQTVHIWQVR